MLEGEEKGISMNVMISKGDLGKKELKREEKGISMNV